MDGSRSMVRSNVRGKLGLLLLVLICTAGLGLAVKPALSDEMLKALKETGPARLTLQAVPLPTGTVYYALIPPGFEVMPAVSERLQSITAFAAGTGSVLPRLMINAGYFDPNNHKTISYITLEGKLAADPTTNEGLTGNQNLKPYLPKVFNRTEFRTYRCHGKIRYDMTPHQAPIPAGCSLRHALGAGPLLLPEDRSVAEAVVAYDAKGKLIRDPFGVGHLNARSAIGLTATGQPILLMGAQVPSEGKQGFSYKQLTSLLQSLGAVKAMALDGGSSSALWVQSEAAAGQPDTATDSPQTQSREQVFYGKFNKEGQPVKRPIKSVLMVMPVDDGTIEKP